METEDRKISRRLSLARQSCVGELDVSGSTEVSLARQLCNPPRPRARGDPSRPGPKRAEVSRSRHARLKRHREMFDVPRVR
ncbi:hypothetical protein GN956_G19897 [Arapaima gigas]